MTAGVLALLEKQNKEKAMTTRNEKSSWVMSEREKGLTKRRE